MAFGRTGVFLEEIVRDTTYSYCRKHDGQHSIKRLDIRTSSNHHRNHSYIRLYRTISNYFNYFWEIKKEHVGKQLTEDIKIPVCCGEVFFFICILFINLQW